MPTTKEEALKITEIFDEYLTPEEAQEITNRLHNEIGENSTNTSLKVSLEMLRALYHKEARQQFIVKTVLLRIALFSIIALHFYVVIGNLIAMFIIPFLAPWYIALPIISFIVSITFSGQPCPLTRLEDKIRHKLGIPQIKYFVGYYIVWPLKRKFIKHAKQKI